jgi:hypothetical protein
LTSEQLEAARAERLRQNGLGTLTFEDARTWIEETGLCLFLPRRQFSSSVAPSFVEAVAGKRNETPDPRQIAAAEELLVRLELADVAVRLNLQGQPGEQPDFVVASWVLPYVYALRGDRDWRRIPQLTGSRAVSPLAVQAYKLLDQGDSTIAQLKQGLGREVSEAGVVRAITELWQQLRIVPVIAAPGQPAKWQLLKHRFQKAIAEGASTSQVTAISVLASIFLQAVIAASMEEVELFLSPLTARSKVREVLRGLVATRQVHTLALGHSPHFYVAGTLPEFPSTTQGYSSTLGMGTGYDYGYARFEREERTYEPPAYAPPTPAAAHPVESQPEPKRTEAHTEPRPESHAPRTPVRKPAAAAKSAPARPHSRPSVHVRDWKKSTPATSGRSARHGAETRGTKPAPHWAKSKSAPAKSSGGHPVKNADERSKPAAGKGKAAAGTWTKSNGHAKSGKPTGNAATGARKTTGSSRKPAMAVGTRAGNNKRYGFTARPKQGTKKRG